MRQILSFAEYVYPSSLFAHLQWRGSGQGPHSGCCCPRSSAGIDRKLLIYNLAVSSVRWAQRRYSCRRI